jgi:hypothetical protein
MSTNISDLENQEEDTKEELKRGKYSKFECEHMISNSHRDPDEVAKEINRSTEAVKNFWVEKGLFIPKSVEDKQEENRLLARLHTLAYWPGLLPCLDDKEIDYYEQNWIAFIKQLNEDVSYSEQIYIKDWLILEIEKKRVLTRERNSIKSIEELKQKVNKLYQGDLSDPNNVILLGNMTTEIAAREQVISQSVSQLEKLNKDIKVISDKLKTDRHTRREKETSSETYWGYVAKLEDENYKKDEEYKALIFKASMEKAKKDLYQLTSFVDQSVDRCVLNSESVLLDDIGENNDETK